MQKQRKTNKYVLFIMVIGFVHVTAQKEVKKVNKNNSNYNLVEGEKSFEEIHASRQINKSQFDFGDSIIKRPFNEPNLTKNSEKKLNEEIEQNLKKTEESDIKKILLDSSILLQKLFSPGKVSPSQSPLTSEHPFMTKGNYP
jgi:hypothetical protein